MSITKKYHNLTEAEKQEIQDRVDWYSEKKMKDMYDDMLDDVYGDVNIAGLSYTTSYAMLNIDPIAYRCGFNDWADAEGYIEVPWDGDGQVLESDLEEIIEEILYRNEEETDDEG